MVPFGSIAASIIGAFAEKVIYNTWETKRVKKIASKPFLHCFPRLSLVRINTFTEPVTTLESCTKLSTELGRILVYTYEDQLRKLSVRGAMQVCVARDKTRFLPFLAVPTSFVLTNIMLQLAKYLGARLFSYMANGHLREDMPVPEQLVAGMLVESMYFTPYHFPG